MSRMRLDSAAARRAFARAAPAYDEYAVLQREVATRLIERLDFCRYEPADVLDLGCATGFTSRALAERYPQARVVALDWSYPMLAVHEAGPDNTYAVCADLHEPPLSTASVDLVFSNLAISWGRDIPSIFSELRRVMRPGAMLVFTCYGPDTLVELKAAWRSVDEGARVHEFPDMHDIGDALVSAGFREPVMDMEPLALDYPDALSLLLELRATGQVNVAAGRSRGLLGRAKFERMLTAFEQFRKGGRYPASFEIIYGTAFAPEEGQPVRTSAGDVATFSVDALRSKPLKKN
ncbi:MAG: malonyl-ACP O-methyltransferase BioC [Lysobacterales bacterium]|jgi:malonyl-CoA O-methyltransferase